MRIEKLRSFVVVALVVGSAIAARAQSLAEVAQREEARRKATASSGKTYTNNDLRPAPPPSALPAQPAAAVGDRTGGDSAEPSADANSNAGKPAQRNADEIRADEIKPPDDGEPAPARGEEYWRKRMSDIRDQLDRDTSYAEAMQTRVGVLTLDFTTRGDAGERIRIGVDRQKALSDLERLTQAVEDGKKAMADLEEEARQAGALPGWLR